MNLLYWILGFRYPSHVGQGFLQWFEVWEYVQIKVRTTCTYMQYTSSYMHGWCALFGPVKS